MIPLVDLKTQYRSIKKEIDTAIEGVLESSQFVLGSAVQSFEAAFAESGTVAAEQAAAHRGFNTAQPLALAALAVPNTLAAGALNARKAFSVAALAVAGPGSQGASIVIDPDSGLRLGVPDHRRRTATAAGD